jgi:hypothetical protein
MNIENTQSEILTKLGNRFKILLDKFEMYVVIIIMLGIALLALNIEYGSLILIISFSTLTVFYYFGSFAISDDKNASKYEKFVDKFSGMSNSVAVMGIFFKLLNWPMYTEMLIIGSLSLLLAVPTLIIIKTRKPELTPFDKRMMIRASIILLISGLLYFMY